MAKRKHYTGEQVSIAVLAAVLSLVVTTIVFIRITSL